jgi:hypothetical protein
MEVFRFKMGIFFFIEFPQVRWDQWLTPVILATEEALIRRITVRSQPRQIAHKTLSRKTLHKSRAGRVAQG